LTLGHIFLEKNCVLWAGEYGNTLLMMNHQSSWALGELAARFNYTL